MSTSNINFKMTTSSFTLNNVIYACDINEKYILVANDINDIEIYSTETFKKLFTYHIYCVSLHIQFHPLYYNVFSITLNNSTAHLFNIDIKTNKPVDKIQYLCPISNSIIKTIFSPYSEGKYLATLSHSNIKIWNITKYSNLNIIRLYKNVNNNINYPMKWSESGEYLIYPKDITKIEVFSIKSNSVKYHLNYEAEDFFFVDKSEQIIALNEDSILIWDAKKNLKIKQIVYKSNFKQCLIDYNNPYIYFMFNKMISLYDYEKGNQIFQHKIDSYSKFFLLKSMDKSPGLFSKLSFSHFDRKMFVVLSIFLSKYNSKNICKLIEAPDTFWDNCVDKINNNFEFLSYKYNQIEAAEIHKKNYLSIEEVSVELDNLIKNYTLEERRKMVVDYMKNIPEDKDICVAYLNYVKNLIKDNTNIDLISNYLKFIEKNNTLLADKFGNSYANFDDEMKVYQALFDQSTSFQEFKYNKTISEKEKLLKLFDDILHLDKDNKDSLNNFIIKKKFELENFLFNQPISFENNKELFYCKNKIVILNNLEKLIKNEKYELIEDMKYCINEVLRRKLFEKEHIENNKIFNMFIIISIAIPQRKIITDYNLNLIDNEGIEVTEAELKKLGFQYDKSSQTFEKDKLITIKENELNLFNLKNLKLYLDTQNKKYFKIFELYKYEYLKKYYNYKFDEDKMRCFMSKILVSKVFKEAFAFFYGDDIKYPFTEKNDILSEEKAKKFVDNYLFFVPLKNETTSAITEKFSMETYIFLNYSFISSTLNANEDSNLSTDIKIIMKALTNGAIAIINDHEINHNFHNYYYCSKNGNETLKTPRKTEMNEREGGNNMEKILFGRVLNNLTLRQSLYILNEKNYEKSLNQFRKEFLELKEEHCKCDGIFSEFYNMKFNVKELSDYIVINFKSNKNEDTFGYISFKLKNDVLGFPNFDESGENNLDEEEF